MSTHRRVLFQNAGRNGNDFHPLVKFEKDLCCNWQKQAYAKNITSTRFRVQRAVGLGKYLHSLGIQPTLLPKTVSSHLDSPRRTRSGHRLNSRNGPGRHPGSSCSFGLRWYTHPFGQEFLTASSKRVPGFRCRSLRCRFCRRSQACNLRSSPSQARRKYSRPGSEAAPCSFLRAESCL